MPDGAWLALAALLAAAGGFWLWRTRLAPFAAIRRWAWRMRGGDLSARVPATPGGGELAADLNVLAEMVQTLSRRTEEQLEAFGAHTTRKERARLSGELHDSLAQTLASVRMQVRLLDAALQHGDEDEHGDGRGERHAVRPMQRFGGRRVLRHRGQLSRDRGRERPANGHHRPLALRRRQPRGHAERHHLQLDGDRPGSELGSVDADADD